jgi:hypothetical protein
VHAPFDKRSLAVTGTESPLYLGGSFDIWECVSTAV